MKKNSVLFSELRECFDLVPGESDIRRGDAEYTGKVCVIGAGLKTEEIEKCFRA